MKLANLDRGYTRQLSFLEIRVIKMLLPPTCLENKVEPFEHIVVWLVIRPYIFLGIDQSPTRSYYRLGKGMHLKLLQKDVIHDWELKMNMYSNSFSLGLISIIPAPFLVPRWGLLGSVLLELLV